jgi:hypothetical protein
MKVKPIDNISNRQKLDLGDGESPSISSRLYSEFGKVTYNVQWMFTGFVLRNCFSRRYAITHSHKTLYYNPGILPPFNRNFQPIFAKSFPGFECFAEHVC